MCRVRSKSRVKVVGEARQAAAVRRDSYLPSIGKLYRKHIGVTKALSRTYEEAACVCLDGGNPPTSFDVRNGDAATRRLLRWHVPTDRERRAWANAIDRLEAAAYGVALAAVEAELGLVAIERARTLSGADYYVAAAGADLLEDAYRLEVSGTGATDARRAHERLRQKLQQVAHPADPSLACVVSFGTCTILIGHI